MKKITLFSVLSVLLIGCSGKNNQMPPAEIPTLPILNITHSSAQTNTEFPVAIQGKTDIEIRPQVSGIIENIFVDEGDYVSKGQSLFKINDNTYRQQYNNAKANLSAAEAALTNAQIEVDKLVPLVQNKMYSEYQLRTAKSNLSIAKSNVEQAKAVLNNAQINLDYTLIQAPTNGYIGRLPRKQGSLISPQDPEALTKLSDIKEVYAYFSLSENDFLNFKKQYEGATISQKIEKMPPVSLILSDNTEYEQKGKVDMVDGQFDKTTGAITLRAKFPNQDGFLRSGNTGKVKISINHDNSILIPQEATVEIQDKIYVFLLDKNNSVSRQLIEVSGKSGTNYLVKNGIHSGDRIILKGFENLPDGVKIIPENSKKEVAKL
ncbi:efflux RND transporter periplasmic adaptor subunit [Flavobacterium sp. U410]